MAISALLQHIGMMCIHQLNNDPLQTPFSTHLLQTPLSSQLLQQTSLDALSLSRVCNILEKAFKVKHHAHMISALVALQVRVCV